jgi:hypothetical protein
MPSSLAEHELIPKWAKQSGFSRCFVYSGSSMRPTFRPGHLLYVRPLSQELKPGDVLVFQGEQEDRFVVHRAVALTPDGWIMRGDGNRLLDAAPVPIEKVIGRVELAEAGGELKPVRSGAWGLRIARLRWALRTPITLLRRFFGWPYRLLRSWTPARVWLFRRFSSQLHTIHFQTPQGTLIKTLWRDRVVARWQPAQRRFECHKPFDLFLEPSLSDDGLTKNADCADFTNPIRSDNAPQSEP